MDKEAKINLYAVLGFAILVAILCSYFVFAVATVKKPLSSTNVSGVIYLNATITNGTAKHDFNWTGAAAGTTLGKPGDGFNATFYHNLSGTWASFTNSSVCIMDSKNVSCWTTYNSASLTDGRYAFNVSFRNKTKITNTTIITKFVLIDNTRPLIYSFNETSSGGQKRLHKLNLSKTYTNYAAVGGRIVLNASIYDPTAGVYTTYSKVAFALYNASGKKEQPTKNFTAQKKGNYWVNETGFNISKYKEGNYTLRFIVNDSVGNSNNSMYANILIDNTKPGVYSANISGVTAGRNYSSSVGSVGWIIVNVSSYDMRSGGGKWADSGYNVSGIQAAYFYVDNTTGTNGTYTATNEGTGYYSAKINTSDFKDGTWHLNVTIHDNALNYNDSASIGNFIFDSTPPVVAFSCGTSDIEQGATCTCTCTATDAISGLNTSYDTDGIYYVAHPSTTSSGTHEVFCTAKDKAGNAIAVSTTYAVTAPGTAAGTTGTGPTSETPSETTTSTVPSVTTTAPATVTIEDVETYGIESINIAVKEDVENVEVNMERYENRPADVSVAKQGAVYRYLKIEIANIGDSLDKAIITAKVPKSWVGSKSLTKDDIAVFKFAGGGWRMLPTTFKSEDDTAYYYESEATRFSYFAIGEKKGELLLEPEEEQQIYEEEAAAAKTKMWLWIGAAVIVIAIIIVALTARKKKRY